MKQKINSIIWKTIILFIIICCYGDIFFIFQHWEHRDTKRDAAPEGETLSLFMCSAVNIFTVYTVHKQSKNIFKT